MANPMRPPSSETTRKTGSCSAGCCSTTECSPKAKMRPRMGSSDCMGGGEVGVQEVNAGDGAGRGGTQNIMLPLDINNPGASTNIKRLATVIAPEQ